MACLFIDILMTSLWSVGHNTAPLNGAEELFRFNFKDDYMFLLNVHRLSHSVNC